MTLSPSEYEEEVRCAALGLEGPNAKSYMAETWADHADLVYDRIKEQGYRNPLVAPLFCVHCHHNEVAHPRDGCPGFTPGSEEDVRRQNRERGFPC